MRRTERWLCTRTSPGHASAHSSCPTSMQDILRDKWCVGAGDHGRGRVPLVQDARALLACWCQQLQTNLWVSYFGKNKFSLQEKSSLAEWIGKMSTICGTPKQILFLCLCVRESVSGAGKYIACLSPAPREDATRHVQDVPVMYVATRAEIRRATCPPGTWRSSWGLHDAEHARDLQRTHQTCGGPLWECMTQIMFEADTCPQGAWRSSRGGHDADHARDLQPKTKRTFQLLDWSQTGLSALHGHL